MAKDETKKTTKKKEDELKKEKVKSAKNKDEKEKTTKKKEDKSNKKDSKKSEKKEEKKSLWVKFRIFCHGVKSEFLKVHWPSKKDMLRYSLATVFFMIFCALFFYIINVVFALIQSLF